MFSSLLRASTFSSHASYRSTSRVGTRKWKSESRRQKRIAASGTPNITNFIIKTWCCATAVACRHPVVFAWSFKHLLILGSRVRVPPLSLLIFPRKPRVLQRIWGFFVGSASTSTSCFHGTISHPFAPKSTLRASDSAVGARGRILAAGRLNRNSQALTGARRHGEDCSFQPAPVSLCLCVKLFED